MAMSCVEEEDSSMDEDEDMPGLESVSSSEVTGPERATEGGRPCVYSRVPFVQLVLADQ